MLHPVAEKVMDISKGMKQKALEMPYEQSNKMFEYAGHVEAGAHIVNIVTGIASLFSLFFKEEEQPKKVITYGGKDEK